MQVGITGASGFLGKHLVAALQARGHDAVAFSRSPSKPVPGCCETRSSAPGAPLDLSGLDAVVNFAGESLIGLWTEARRRRILESRVSITSRLVEAISRRPDGPRLLVSASGVGIYGDRGDEALDESKGPGTGFLADVARQWEVAATDAERCGARVIRLRIGYVLGADGGAFPPVRRAFQFGLGGTLGTGRQWVPPIHVADVAGLIVFLLEHEDDRGDSTARGVFNAVCPNPIRNEDFTKAVARALGRPAILPVPAFALRGLIGALSTLLLNSQRAVPAHAQRLGYEWKFPTLVSMLADLCRAGDANP